MIRTLLICGLIAGMVAGIAAFTAAKIVGEPAVQQAIAYEEANAVPEPAAGLAADGHAHTHSDEGASFSRSTQSGVGLLAGTVIVGLSIGGLFALVFSMAYGRIGRAAPKVTAGWLALGGFVTVFLVPFMKYPATPPAIGSGDTIGDRTLLYFGMIAISLLAAFIGVRTRAWLLERESGSATLAGIAVYGVIVLAAATFLPSVNEIPADFSANTLWLFRKGTLFTQAALWGTLGVTFAYAAQYVMTKSEREAAKQALSPDAAAAA